MLDWFGNLGAEALLGRWSLREAQLFLDGLQRAATTAAILVGGGWAYMKFVRGRTFKLRLEPAVDGSVWRGPAPTGSDLYLLADCRAKNAGLSRFAISYEESALQVFTSAAAVESPDTDPASPEGGSNPHVTAEPVSWEELGGYPVFADSARVPLEPGEQAQDEALLKLPGGGPAALKLVLTVTAKVRGGRSWTVTRVVRLAGAVDNTEREGQTTTDGGPEVNG